MDSEKRFVPHYDKADRDHMRQLLQKCPRFIEFIAEGRIPFGSTMSAEMIDLLVASIGYDNEKQKDDEEIEELKSDRYSIINLYGGIKKLPSFLPFYRELGNLLHKYGLFYEEVTLWEDAVADGCFSDADRVVAEERLSMARQYLEADDAELSDSERVAVNLHRALQKKPLDEKKIKTLLEQCKDDALLYDFAINTDIDPELNYLQGRAAGLIQSRDYRYALGSHVLCKARISMILGLYDSLYGDNLFIARTILTDPYDDDKVHMLIYCMDESLLMLGWRYVYRARDICEEYLHKMGFRFPEAYLEMNLQDKMQCEKELLEHAADIATEILSEDEAVRERLSDESAVDSDPLHLFISIHHPRLDIRLQHANKLKSQVYIAYAGSWTSDDEIKESLSVKIDNTKIITEMIYGDETGLDGMDLVFAFRKPEDLTLQDRFCVQIMKNHPDRVIREHVRAQLLRGDITIPGVDLTQPDPLYKETTSEV